MRFRRARISDADALARLINKAFVVERPVFDGDRTSAEAVGSLLEKGTFLLAENCGDLVACVYVEQRLVRPSDQPEPLTVSASSDSFAHGVPGPPGVGEVGCNHGVLAAPDGGAAEWSHGPQPKAPVLGERSEHSPRSSHSDELRGYIGLLSVDPAQQGSGLGRKALQAAEEFCCEAGCIAVDLRVISARTPLPAFYRHLGYVETHTSELPADAKPKIPCHYVHMSKRLAGEMK